MVNELLVPSSGMVTLAIELVDKRVLIKGGRGRGGRRLAAPDGNSESGSTVVGQHVRRTLL